jgi:sRNA-binding protein
MFSDEPTVNLDQDDEIIALLAESWPRCFMSAEDRRLPLKVGIFHDLKAALGGKVSPDQLSRALGTYCSAPDYQRRLKDGAARLDLDGQRAGTVTPSEAMGAGGQSRAAGQVPAQACTGSEAIVAGRLARGWRAAKGDRRVKLGFARNPSFCIAAFP